jgi:hypothetical protein
MAATVSSPATQGPTNRVASQTGPPTPTTAERSPTTDPAIPSVSGGHRPGAEPRPDLVSVVSEGVPKRRSGESAQSVTLTTRLSVRVRARTGPSSQAEAWADVEVLDGAGGLIHSAMCSLDGVGQADADGECFGLDRTVYEGSSLLPPGSVARPAGREARKLRYRVYLVTEGDVVTDGLLHEHDLAPDAMSW